MTKTKKTTKANCQMCGAEEGKPHHDASSDGVIVALEKHRCLLHQPCWMHLKMICQPCKQGTYENEIEHSGTPEGMLAKAARLQTEFWDAVRELEMELDIEIDSTCDLEGMTIEDLKEAEEEA
jgi:hypothetical protein